MFENTMILIKSRVQLNHIFKGILGKQIINLIFNKILLQEVNNFMKIVAMKNHSKLGLGA